MNVMLDLNVLLDYAQNREPFQALSKIIISEVLKKRLIGYIPTHAITTLYYLIAKENKKQKAYTFIDWLLENFMLPNIETQDFLSARKLKFSDFEDSVVASLAFSNKCDFIITRNKKDFINSPVIALNPEEFIRQFVSIEQ